MLKVALNTNQSLKMRKIQGQITQFWLADFAKIRTWPVFPTDLIIAKVWNRSDKIYSSYRCKTKIVNTRYAAYYEKERKTQTTTLKISK